MKNLQGHAGFMLAAEAFFKLFPGRGRCDSSDPEMVILFELMDKVAAAVQTEEPTPSDPSKAAMDLEHSLLRAALENTDPDEPVVQEVPRG